ncbi:MAG: tRNA (adenosine(37)-N6)-dimethylallyltransferase MiaA [Pseudorhodoplanes sp.]
MTGRKQRTVLIAGPTASGKSALALALAARTPSVLINADSMQVYRDLRVLTARPSPQEEVLVPHALYGHVDAAENYSVGRWSVAAAAAIAQARAQGRLPIVVGGTGLYFKVLTQGLSSIPAIPAEIRALLRSRLESEGAEALHADLMKRDPLSANRLMPRDRSRIVRALEVVEATGRPLSDWHRDGMKPAVAPEEAHMVFLMPERGELVQRIHRRFDAMLDNGALDEVRALDARSLDPLLPAMKAHGVPWLRRHLRGEIALEAAGEGAKMDTRRYAKRQVTWFRNQMPGWVWLKPEEANAAIARLLD